MDLPDPTILCVGPETLGPRVRTWAREAGIELASHASVEANAPVAGRPLAVWSQGREHLLEAARVARSADVPTNDPDAVALCLDAIRRAVALQGAGIPVAPEEAQGTAYELDAFFRADGAFVPCGLTLVSNEPGTEGWMPSGLGATRERALASLARRAAQALGLSTGPISARLQVLPEGPAVAELLPAFRGRTQSVHVTRLVHGRSPIQAWFASLVEAGGPFDTLPAAGSESVAWRTLAQPSPSPAALRACLPRNPRLSLDFDETGAAILAARGWSLTEARHLLAAGLRRWDEAESERVVA